MIGSINSTQSALLSTLQQLSSGKRINSAADNPAGLAIAERLTTQLNGSNAAINNAYSGLSLADTTGGGLSQISDSLQRIRELTVQAGNGTLNASDRAGIQQEIGQLQQNIDQIAGNTQFNGQNVLDGTFAGQSFQVGPNPNQTVTVTTGNATTQALGINGLDVTTQAGATSALDAIDNALSNVGTQQANIGATQARLSSTVADLGNSYENLAAARSRIQDTDFAQAASNLSQERVQNEASVLVQAKSNALQGTLLSLIQQR